jgi:glycerol-3-phosphate acyltransferase PlsY
MIRMTLWAVAAFWLGALPLSVWLGRRITGKDIREYGDGNPGGTNVGRASGNKALGALAIFLDMLKGAAPIALAHYVAHIEGWALVPIIIAPILGTHSHPSWRSAAARPLPPHSAPGPR